MKLFKSLLVFVCTGILIYSSSGCERDDICAEPTTPFLIVKFIDFENGTDIKRPIELQVKAVGIDEPFDIGSVRDSILIPLKTDNPITAYEFTINSDTTNDEESLNTDTISFQYTLEELYVSSACGFKVNYKELTQSSSGTAAENWIKEIRIQRREVTDETFAHILILH